MQRASLQPADSNHSMNQTSGFSAFRGSILDFTADPYHNSEQAYRYYEDGLLVINRGTVFMVDDYPAAKARIPPETSVHDHRGKLIMPGFIDTHIHYPQAEMIAACGEQLLEWLDNYAFPAERKYQDYVYARGQAEFFIQELLRNGTTTAVVSATVHPESVDAIFEAAAEKNMRIIAGKVLMDRHAPADLLDTPRSSYDASEALIRKWHTRGRLLYAITPRFAPASTPEQLRLAGHLSRKYPGVYIHTHLSENRQELAWVKSLFPDRKSYLDVYDHYGLIGRQSILAHAIHISHEDMLTLSRAGSAVAFCPTSNLFLGSGLFRMHDFKDAGVTIGMGTDVGAGTSFSMFVTLNEAYKVLQLQSQTLSAPEGFYQATLGSARAIALGDRIGSFAIGKEADFIILDWAATALQRWRMKHCRSLEDRLFALMMLGDDRNVNATYIMGEKVYQRACL